MQIEANFIREIVSPRSNGWGKQQWRIISPSEQRPVKDDVIFVVGYHLPTIKNVVYRLDGEFITNNYGIQFDCKNYEERLNSKNDIINFLSSGAIKGIGRKIAERIYDAFGESTMRVLEEDPARLESIKGISPGKIASIVREYRDNKTAMKIVALFSHYGVSNVNASRIYEVFGTSTEKVISETPYLLTRYQGFTFDIIEAYAKDVGFPYNSKQRIQAAIMRVFLDNETSGNTSILANTVPRLLHRVFKESQNRYGIQIPGKAIIDDVEREMLKEKQIVRIVHNNKVFLQRISVYNAEIVIAKKLCEQATISSMEEPLKIKKAIEQVSLAMKIESSDEQIAAVEGALQNNIAIITGGPGTGKTHTLNLLCETYTAMYPDHKILQLSPTGRAARKMQESTGRPSSTFHSAMKIRDKEDSPEPLIYDLIICDEISMADVFIMEKLCLAVSDQASIILIGDTDQLQSVGAGAVLRDLIDSKVIPVYKLTKTFRQAANTTLFQNIIKIKNRECNLRLGADFQWVQETDDEKIAEKVLTLFQEKVKQYTLDGVVCISPIRKGEFGVNEMNRKIQEVINPASANKAQLNYGKQIFRVGDPVMHLVNEEYVCNGDTGYVIDVYHDSLKGDILRVKYDGIEKEHQIMEYTKSELDKVTLCYAMTVHKSQGSEYSCVISPMSYSCGKKILTYSLFYTAVSRAKKEYIGVGDQHTAVTCIQTDSGQDRLTHLTLKLVFYQYNQFINTNPFSVNE